MRFVFALFAVGLVACSSSDPGHPNSCQAGTLECACFDDGTCLAGLDCIADRCVQADGDTRQDGDPAAGDPDAGDPDAGDIGLGDDSAGDDVSGDSTTGDSFVGPICGNDVAEGTASDEECDGSDLRGEDCVSLGYPGGTLGCTNCVFDVSACSTDPSSCGDGIKTGFERCDGGTLPCSERGLGNGTITCDSLCQHDFSSCDTSDFCSASGYYGNGVCNSCPELGGIVDVDCANHCGADGVCSDFWAVGVGAFTCVAAGFGRDPDCTSCGNGIIDGKDKCDAADLASRDCASFGLVGGAVACTADCTWDLRGCSVPPFEVISTTPSGGTVDVPTTAEITVAFSKPFDSGTLDATSFVVETAGAAVGGALSANVATATFTPAAPLIFGATYTVTVTTAVTDLLGTPLVADEVFSFTSEPGIATQLVFDLQPTDASADDRFTVVASYRDASGSLVANETTPVTLSIRNNPPSALLEDALGSNQTTIVQAPVAGVATFANVAIRTSASGYTLLVQAPSLQRESDAFDVTWGAATTALFETSPPATGLRAGDLFGADAVVHDAHGNLVEDATIAITVSLESSNGAVLLGPILTQDPSFGGVSFVNLTVHKSGPGYRLRASAVGLTYGLSGAFEVGPAAVDSLEFVAQPPDTIVAGDAFTVTVVYNDRFGNWTPSASTPISLIARDELGFEMPLFDAQGLSHSQFPGMNPLQATPANGLATFATIALRKAGPGFTLLGTTTAIITIPAVVSSPLNVSPGAPVVAAFEDPWSVGGFPPGPFNVHGLLMVRVDVQDVWGNVVDTATDSITIDFGIRANPEAGFTGTTTLTPVLGVADFGDLAIDQEGAGFTLMTSATGLLGMVSDPFTLYDFNAPGTIAMNVDATSTAASSLGGKSSVTLSWIEPGDDDVMGQPVGRVDTYEVRFSLTPITNFAEFLAATAATAPTPVVPGSSLNVSVGNLDPNTTYYFAVRAADGAGNFSSIATTSAFTPNCIVGDVLAPSTRTCVDNACDPTNPCTTPPPDDCLGDVARTYAGSGACTPAPGSVPDFTCVYTPAQTDCSVPGQICLGGTCVVDPCQSNPCVAGSATCDADELTLRIPGGACTPTGPFTYSCSDATTDCSQGGDVCYQGACATAWPPQPGDLLITEVMHTTSGDPAEREWFEVENLSGTLLTLQAITLEEWGSGAQHFMGEVALVPPDARFVFAVDPQLGLGGSVLADYIYSPTIRLPIAGGTLALRDLGGTVIATLWWHTGFPMVPDRSINLWNAISTYAANQNYWYWCEATQEIGSSGVFGTPGSANSDCGWVVTPPLDFCIVQYPKNFTSTPAFDESLPLAAGTSASVYSRFFEPSVTDLYHAANDYYPNLESELGWGSGNDASLWTSWVQASFNPVYVEDSPFENDDEVVADLVIGVVGNYPYGYRYRLVDPSTGVPGEWSYCDAVGSLLPGTSASANWSTAEVY